MTIQDYILISLAVWLLFLTLVLGWVFNYFRRLSRDVGKKNLIKVLDDVLAKEKNVIKGLDAVEKKVTEFENLGQLHIQKIGIVRFNPFKELGGDHSFSVALLDGKETGFIITGLHTRERTRVYLKSVNKGKSDLELSNEENEALVLAKKK